MSLLFPNPLLDRLWELNKPAEAAFRALGRLAGILLLLLAAATLAGGVALRRGRRWAWWFAMVLFAIDGAGDIVSLAVTGDWLRSAAGLVICSTFLCALSRRPVRQFFERD